MIIQNLTPVFPDLIAICASKDKIDCQICCDNFFGAPTPGMDFALKLCYTHCI